jgi:tetratricopeptide (TPR) repeat protein
MKSQYDKALDDLKEAINLNPNESMPYAVAGVLYKCIGKKETAVLYLEKAVCLNPNLEWVKSELREIQGF